ncbi:MAG TPA: glycosyltransferase [Acetobacteraceae bacterium]|nr:glycosyltransferase [Acetobacteraceae bacterium]
MSKSPSLLQRFVVLTETVDRRRARIAFDLLRRGELRNLLVHFALHTAFRWRLKRIGTTDAGSIDFLPMPDEPSGTPQVYTEAVWPADEPLISVIIPCFNYGRFVVDAIESVLAQTFQAFEIIVVEGGSTDGFTRDVVVNLQFPKTRILVRPRPCRAGDNRNFGIQHARGKYICCLDADDLLQPTYLEKAVFLLETFGYDIVSTSIHEFGARDGRYNVLPRPVLSDMLRGNHVTTCAVFRRALWQDAGGFQDSDVETQGHIHEDWRFWTRLAALGARIINITGEALFCYRIHPSPSQSSQSGVLPMPEQARLIRELNQDLVTRQAEIRSRRRARLRRRSVNGIDNLVKQKVPHKSTGTVLLAAPYLALGGAERLLSAVTQALTDAGYRVVIVTTLPILSDVGDTTAWFERSSSEIYHLPRFLPESCWPDFVDYLIPAKGVDVILLAGSTWFYSAIPHLKSRYPHLHLIDLLFNTTGHVYNNRRHAAWINRTIVEGEEVRSWLLSHGETPGRIRVINSGVDLCRFQPRGKSATVLAALGLVRDTFIVGFSGRLSEEKAPLTFMQVAANQTAPSMHFIMTGTGPLEEQVRALLRQERLARRVHFAGVVEDITEYLACYDVLMLPSLMDGRPMVVMEALAMGIPVVASRVGCLPDLLIEGTTGFLCDPYDLEDFSEKIKWLHGHRSARLRMSQAARTYAEEHFRVDRMLSAYVETITAMDDQRPAVAE